MQSSTLAGVLVLSVGLATTVADAAPKKAAAKVPASVIVENNRNVELIEISLSASGAQGKPVVTYKKAIGPGKKATVAVKGLKSCSVSVAATFADQNDVDEETDVCADRVIRFVE